MRFCKFLFIALLFLSDSILFGSSQWLMNTINEYDRTISIFLCENADLIKPIMESHKGETINLFYFSEKNPGVKSKGLVWLKSKLDLDDILSISSCEHFDIAILPQRYIASLKESGGQLNQVKKIAHQLIEVSDYPIANTASYWKNSEYTVISTDKKHYALHRFIKPRLSFHSSILHPRQARKAYSVKTTHTQKTISKLHKVKCGRYIKYSEEAFQPGINLLTALIYNVSHPSRKKIIRNLPKSINHPDWFLQNMILLSDTKIVLIDFIDPTLPEQAVGNFYKNFLDVKSFILQSKGLSKEEANILYTDIFGFKNKLILRKNYSYITPPGLEIYD